MVHAPTLRGPITFCLPLAALLLAGALQAQKPDFHPKRPEADSVQEPCITCHVQGKELRGQCPPRVLLAASTHAELDCTDCHEFLHPEGPPADDPEARIVGSVDCSMCHEAATSVYQAHGRMKVGQDADIPACWSCHGTHSICGTSDPRSTVHASQLGKTCMICHTDVDLVQAHDILEEGPIRLYQASVHGQASTKGIYASATCNDCHSSTDPDGNRTAHRILGAADPDSTIYRFNIPDTCARCHQPVAKDYWEGIHGLLVRRGEVDSPVCTTCHGEHGIISPSDPLSPVSAAKVAERTCSPCHESVILNEKYGVKGGRLASYVDSYHGHKAKAGDVRVANCASCHGAHRILPSSDPTSSIHPNNLQETCGECHPGISSELAQTGIHTTATAMRTGWAEFFRQFYIILIVVTIGLMLLHNIAHYVRHVKMLRRQPFIVRLTANETAQHWLLMITFIVLVISGFALRFSEAWWVQMLFGWGDGKGFELRGTVHRVAAVGLVVCSLWHMVYLCTRRGRTTFRDLMVSKRDPRNIMENVRFFLGLQDSEARYGRFTYMEKAEYWALVWGTVIMTVTGIFLMFDNYFSERWNLPKGFLDVMLVIHYYEAWLATLAIFVWHIYGTVFSPTTYPMNPAWMDGRMPRQMYEHEHPEGPRLKGRVLLRAIAEEDALPEGVVIPEAHMGATHARVPSYPGIEDEIVDEPDPTHADAPPREEGDHRPLA